MKHAYKMKTKYVEVDAMKQVHNSKYLVYFEEARVDLVRQEGYPYSQIEEDGILFPISETKIEYKIPLKYDEDFIVEVEIEYLKNFSMKFLYTIINANDQIACSGFTIHAFIDKETLDFVDIPEKLRKILEKYLITK